MYWQDAIEAAGQPRPMVGLTGVWRVVKTTLARSLPDVAYFDCELPRVRRIIEEDPAAFGIYSESLRCLRRESGRVMMVP